MECLPEKLNPVVKPLMESMKREKCQIIQQLSAQYLVKLLDLVRNRVPNPNNKIVTNLCTLLKSDSEYTPKIVSQPLRPRNVVSSKLNLTFSGAQMFTPKTIREYNMADAAADRTNPYHGVLTLSLQSKANDAPTSSNGSVLRGPGRPPIIDVSLDDCTEIDDPVSRPFYRVKHPTQLISIENVFSAASKTGSNASAPNSPFKPFARTSVPI